MGEERALAKRVVTVLTDDISGKEGDVETIPFALDGVSYEIDLGPTNAKAFRKALGAYCDKARRVKAVQTSRSRSGRRTDLAEIRAWANENNMPVSDRGRVPQSIIDAYDAR